MDSYNNSHYTLDAFYSSQSFSSSSSVGYSQHSSSYSFGAGAHTVYPSLPSNSRHNHQPLQTSHSVYDPSFSPSRFVQPSPANPTYGFPTAQQWAEPFYSGAPLGRRNSAVDTASDIGPTRPRSNSNHKHAVSSPYSKSKVQRGGSSSKPSASASAAFSNLPPQYLRLPQGVEPAKNELLISPIVFKYVESRAAGVRLFDIEHNSDLLEGVNDMVFAQSGLSWREIRLSFVWPGYKSSDNLKRFKLKDGTRGRLLFTAGAALKKLMAEARYVEGAEAAWSIRRPNGTLRFSEKDVLILGLQHMGGASFLIELAVKLKSVGDV